MSTALSTRALNRALLARQLLLRRDPRTPEAALERLLALQAQQARPPFIALWSRLDAFDRCQLLDAIHARRIVRSTFLRGTLHLATAPDYLRFRASLQPVLDAGMTSILKARGAVIDVDAIVARARQEFATPRTFTEVRTALLEQFPDADERAMGYAARMSLPLVIAPDTSEFGYPPDPRFTNAATWLGGPLDDTAAALEALVRRYLAACGPATVADAQTWSGLSQLKPVFERLRPELHVFREGKRELFDLPNAPLPDEDTPAPRPLPARFRRRPALAQGSQPHHRRRVSAPGIHEEPAGAADLPGGRFRRRHLGHRHPPRLGHHHGTSLPKTSRPREGRTRSRSHRPGPLPCARRRPSRFHILTAVYC